MRRIANRNVSEHLSAHADFIDTVMGSQFQLRQLVIDQPLCHIFTLCPDQAQRQAQPRRRNT